MNAYWAVLVFLLLFHMVASIARRGDHPRRGRAFLLSLAFLPATFTGLVILLNILYARNTPTEASEAIMLGGVVGLVAIGLASAFLLWRWKSGTPIIVFSALLTWGLLSLLAPLPAFLTFQPVTASFLVLLGSLVLPHGLVRVMTSKVSHKVAGITFGVALLGPAIILAPLGSFVALGNGATGSFTEAFLLELRPDNDSVGYALDIPIVPAAPTREGSRLTEILLQNARVQGGSARLEAAGDGRLRVIGQGPVTVVSAIEYYGDEPGERLHGGTWGETPVTLLPLQPLTLDVHWRLDVGRVWYGCTFTGAESRFSLSQDGELAPPGSPLPYACI